MKPRLIALLATLAIFTAVSTAFAVCSSSPAQPPGTAPYGLNVQGAASGVKLTGTIEISFSNLGCNAGYEAEYGSCSETGPNAATARVAIRLSSNKTNADNSNRAFYVDLGSVPFQDAQRVQAIALEQLRKPILDAFFGGDFGQQIYLKEFSLYTQANISTAPADDRYSEFAAMANLTLAVN